MQMTLNQRQINSEKRNLHKRSRKCNDTNINKRKTPDSIRVQKPSQKPISRVSKIGGRKVSRYYWVERKGY
jgi:hypothetical protein